MLNSAAAHTDTLDSYSHPWFNYMYFRSLSVAKNTYRSVVVIAVEVWSTAGAAGAAPTTGAAAGGWSRAGTNASCLPPAFPDAGPEKGFSMIKLVQMKVKQQSK